MYGMCTAPILIQSGGCSNDTVRNLQVERHAPTSWEDSQTGNESGNSLEASDENLSGEAEVLPESVLEMEPASPQSSFLAAPSPPRSPSTFVEVARAEDNRLGYDPMCTICVLYYWRLSSTHKQLFYCTHKGCV